MPVDDALVVKLNSGGDQGKAERYVLKKGIPQDVLDQLNGPSMSMLY